MDDFLLDNLSQTPRIVNKVSKKNKHIIQMFIFNKNKVLQKFESENESFVVVLCLLYGYYFLNKIQYPIQYESIFGFFHEALGLNETIYFEKPRTVTYLNILSQIK